MESLGPQPPVEKPHRSAGQTRRAATRGCSRSVGRCRQAQEPTTAARCLLGTLPPPHTPAPHNRLTAMAETAAGPPSRAAVGVVRCAVVQERGGTSNTLPRFNRASCNVESPPDTPGLATLCKKYIPKKPSYSCHAKCYMGDTSAVQSQPSTPVTSSLQPPAARPAAMPARTACVANASGGGASLPGGAPGSQAIEGRAAGAGKQYSMHRRRRSPCKFAPLARLRHSQVYVCDFHSSSCNPFPAPEAAEAPFRWAY